MSGKDILAAIEARAKKCPIVKVSVPEWGCDLWFRKDITIAEQQQIRAGIPADEEAALMASYVLHQAMDADGKPVFEVDAISRATFEGKAGVRVLARIMAEVGAPETVAEAKND